MQIPPTFHPDPFPLCVPDALGCAAEILTGDNGPHLRSHQHDFRYPDMVGITGVPPGEISGMGLIPRQNPGCKIVIYLGFHA